MTDAPQDRPPQPEPTSEAQGRQYPNCQYILRAQGKLYPRTCAECGLAGPCKLELDARMRYGWVDPSQAEMDSALRDAIAGGVGYLIDGVRISPERVQLVRPPVTPVPANHEIKNAERYRHLRDTSMAATIADLPPEKAASITAATRQLIADEFDAAIDVEIAAGTLLAAMRGEHEGEAS